MTMMLGKEGTEEFMSEGSESAEEVLLFILLGCLSFFAPRFLLPLRFGGGFLGDFFGRW